MAAPKIVTCCYCGTRAVLVLSGRERHELSCASCGAPLHEMKMLRAGLGERPPAARPSSRPGERAPKYDARRRKGKRRKSLGRRVLEDAIDLIEDIFD